MRECTCCLAGDLTAFLKDRVWNECHIVHALTFRFWCSLPQMHRSRARRACELDRRLALCDGQNKPEAD